MWLDIPNTDVIGSAKPAKMWSEFLDWSTRRQVETCWLLKNLRTIHLWIHLLQFTCQNFDQSDTRLVLVL